MGLTGHQQDFLLKTILYPTGRGGKPFLTIHSTAHGLIMAPRVVSVPTDLGASGDRLWAPEAGNIA